MSDTFELELVAMAHGGRALGRHDGKTIFVPYAIPGEVVTARLTEDKGRIAFAEGVTLVAASADRVFPACPHFGPGRCGGCHWQHIDIAAQTLLKQDVLADQLARIGKFDDADVRDITPSPVAWGYRHRMMFQRVGGTWGLPGADGESIIPIDECHILHPDLLDLLERIDFDAEGIERMTLQIGTDGAHMMILHVNSEDDAPELLSDMSASVNLILPDNEPVNLIGDSHSVYTINGRGFRVTAGSFFRANVAALPALIDCIVSQLPAEGGAALDLYGGVGLFSAFIAPHVDVLTLVESYPPAATDADDNLADFDHVDIIEGAVEDVLDSLDDAEADYTVALLDPPGGGLSREVIDGLAASRIPRLIYLADDPATLARDARRLVEHGYVLGAVFPFDLDPQTYHVGAVAVLDWRG